MSVATHWVKTDVNTHVCMLLDNFINTFLIASPEENVTVYMFGIPRASVTVDMNMTKAHRTTACFICYTFNVVLLNFFGSTFNYKKDTGLDKFYCNTNISLFFLLWGIVDTTVFHDVPGKLIRAKFCESR
jgi:hypothetical protein